MTHPAADVESSPTDSSALAIWGFAVALATLGTAILWEASPGINYGVWTSCAVIALFATIRERHGSISAPSIAAGVWAVILAFGVAVTTDGQRVAVLVLSTAVLLAVALVTSNDSSLDALRPSTALQAPLVALGDVFTGAGLELRGTIRDARSPAFTSVIRATLITLPLVTALVFLLAEADPVFAAMRNAMEHIVPDDIVSKMVFFVIVLGVTLGAYGGVQRGLIRPHASPQYGGPVIGALERRVLMTALAAIMWLFATSATVSLLENPAAIAGSGVTYAEYVHRGFAELSIAATLVLGATLVTRRAWITSDRWTRRLAFAAIAGECGMIAIAFTRVIRYEQAYGFTVLRLYAQAYMVILACMSVLLLIEISARAASHRFAFHSASAALVVLAACVFWNTDAWIVRHNVDRYAAMGTIDLEYLEHDLSADATPALIASLPRLQLREQTALTGWLCEIHYKKPPRDSRWFAWNLRASRELAARRDWYRSAGSNCTPTS